MRASPYRRSVADQLERLRHEHTVTVRLHRLSDLVEEPEADPWRPDLSTGTGDVVSVLISAKYVPEKLVLHAEVEDDVSDADLARVRDGLRALSAKRAEAAWREAMAVRNEGWRQMPLSIVIAIVAAFLAYGLGYLANQAGVNLPGAVLAILAGLAITIAWVTSWMVMEYALYDWRDPARRALAHDRLAHCELTVSPYQRTASPGSQAGTTARDERRGERQA